MMRIKRKMRKTQMSENQSDLFSEDDSLFINSFRYAPIGKALTMSTGKFIKVNPSYCNFMGYTEEELLFLDYQSITHPDDIGLTLEGMKKLVSGEIPYFQAEQRFIHKDGHIIWAFLSCSAIPAKDGNDPVVIAQIVDITKRKEAEEELILAKEHLESFINNTSDGIAIMDLEGRVLKVNPALENMFGWSETEMKGKRFPVTPKASQDDAEYLLREARLGNIISNFETVKQCKNGDFIHVSITSSPIKDRLGNIISVAGSIRNIHERKTMESQLKESEQRYRLTVENPLNIVTRHDIEGNYLYVSPSCFEITGYEDHELLGLNLEKFIHSEDIERVKEHFKRLVEFDIIQPVTYRYLKKDGTIGWNESTGRAIPDIHTGMIKEVVIVTKDITKQMELTNKLKKSQELFEAISQHSKDLITIADPNGLTRYASPALTKLLGYESHEVLNKHTTEFWHPDDIVAVSNSDLLRNSDEGIFECRVRHKDGHYVSFETSVKVVRDHHENIERIVGIGRDITERKQAEHYMVLSEKLTVVSQLAAGVAHEIRNPLTAIKGFIRLLKEKIPDEEYYFNIIIDEIKRVELILSELLLLSKPKETAWEKKNMESILRQVVALLRTQAVMQNIDIIESYDDPELEIWCDENSLKQVFINLIKNAIEAMPGGGEIYLSMEKVNDEAVIRLVDQGCGIPPDKLQNIGTPFYTTKENGTGLGTMISYNIIDNHHGKINIDSEVNKGTTFVIYLPLNFETEK